MIKKISIGANIVKGPWGGGNLFFKNFKSYFESLNIEVINHLVDPDIDIILLTDPRKNSLSSSFTHIEIEKYKKNINNKVVVVQRINECDERKSTKGINNFYIQSNTCADYTIFVSNWLKKIYNQLGLNADSKVILGGGDSNIFTQNNITKWDKDKKFKLVSHHWSSNKNKGFEIYNRIDSLLDDEFWSDKLEFNYIGNKPLETSFKNINLIQPLSGTALAGELKKCNGYITASVNEPSGNHHIEAGQCGLPIMYIDSGGIPEYCKDFGLEYNTSNLEEKLLHLMKNYDDYFNKMKNYPHNNENMMKQYHDIFENLIQNRKISKKKKNVLKKIYFQNYFLWLRIKNYIWFIIFSNFK